MEHFKYLIVGGGMTADAAVRGIRSVDPSGKIGVISAETDPPYNRPPLTKGLWKGDPVEKIWRKTEDQNVVLHLGRTVRTIEPQNKQLLAADNNRYSWEKLLLATGGSPRKFPFENDQVIYFRTLQDYQRLRALTEKNERFAVIGGGFIGSELAASLTMNQKKVVMIFPGQSIGNRVYPAELSQFLSEYYRQKGVEVRGGEKVIGIEGRGKQMVVRTNGQEFVVDGVVAGLGIVLNTDLAEKAGLKIENGIVVDEFLRTSNPDIYAAGDVAAFYNPALGKRIRVEHEDNANTMGRVAGVNMGGKPEAYHHLPFFYSDLFDLGYEAVGELDSRLEAFADWKQPNKEGVVYYLEKYRVRGVLLWNVWNQVDAARALIAEPGPFTAQNLKGRLK
jgi:3-phenylpropionate/trans-cinnamate dioxygenase ferredoxin reductase subunit